MSALAIDISLELGAFSLRIAQRIELEGVTGVFGPSGSGKTTLLRTIAGLETRAKGTIMLDGDRWQDETRFARAHVRRIGYVFQDDRLFDHLDVKSNISFPLRFRARGEIGVDDVVAALGLEPLLERRPATLSGGERQRVAIARALVGKPRLLLMDEPVSSLDGRRRRAIIDAIAELPVRFGIPVIYVTHDLGELIRLADTALFLENGRIIASGDVGDVARRAEFPSGPTVRDAASILTVQVQSHTDELTTLTTGNQALRIPKIDWPTGQPLRIRIAARDVVVAVRRPEGLSIRNVLRSRITSLTMREGGLCDVNLVVDDQTLTARITRNAADELRLEEGNEVFALVKSVAIDDSLGT